MFMFSTCWFQFKVHERPVNSKRGLCLSTKRIQAVASNLLPIIYYIEYIYTLPITLPAITANSLSVP